MGGKTLEMLVAERGVAMPKWDGSDKTEEAWRVASARFAAGASGIVRAVVGERLRESNIWSSIELPALMQNARVTRIIAIDPATLQETMLFDRSTESTHNQAPIQHASEARDTDRRAARAFMNEPQENAIQQHPMLAGAYASMTAIEKHTRTSGLSDEQRSTVLAAARENIAKSIWQGHYPEIKIRDTNEATREREHAFER
jgi:hypothetical protein